MSAQEAERLKVKELAEAIIACTEAATSIISAGSDPHSPRINFSYALSRCDSRGTLWGAG